MNTQRLDDWIPVNERMPPIHKYVRIRLKDNPRHDPGDVVWSNDGLWHGYQRNYFASEVSHWRSDAN